MKTHRSRTPKAPPKASPLSSKAPQGLAEKNPKLWASITACARRQGLTPEAYLAAGKSLSDKETTRVLSLIFGSPPRKAQATEVVFSKKTFRRIEQVARELRTTPQQIIQRAVNDVLPTWEEMFAAEAAKK